VVQGGASRPFFARSVAILGKKVKTRELPHGEAVATPAQLGEASAQGQAWFLRNFMTGSFWPTEQVQRLTRQLVEQASLKK
jgi:hypothetical protein